MWSFTALGIHTAVDQRGKRRQTFELQSMGEYLNFDQAVRFVDALVVFFCVSRCSVVMESCYRSRFRPIRLIGSLIARPLSLLCSWGFMFPYQNSSGMLPISHILAARGYTIESTISPDNKLSTKEGHTTGYRICCASIKRTGSFKKFCNCAK